jgi:hypothetical protein
MPWAVFAGAAATVYGSRRPLTDVDILVPAAEEDRVTGLFPEARSRRFADGIQALMLSGFDILAGLAMLDLDGPMQARLVRHEIMATSVPVIPREDNIFLKAMWGRGDKEGKHDWEDVEAMLAHAPYLDWEYLRWRAESCPFPEQTRLAVERLDALWRKRSTGSSSDEGDAG